MEIRVIETEEYWRIQCPATNAEVHVPRDGRWSFNGDLEKPTFSPSINETTGFAGETHEQMKAGRISARNHFFIRNGEIQYCSDCTHAMKGKTLPLPVFPIWITSKYYPDKV